MDHFFDRRLLDEEQRLSKLLESLESKSDLSRDRLSIATCRPFRTRCEKGVQTQELGGENSGRKSPHATWVSILAQQEQADLHAMLAEKDRQIASLQQLLRGYSDQLRRSQESQRAIGASLQSKLIQLESQIPSPVGGIIQSMEADIERLGVTRNQAVSIQKALTPPPRPVEHSAAEQETVRVAEEPPVFLESNPLEQEDAKPPTPRLPSKGIRNSYIARPIVSVKQRAKIFSDK